MKYVVKIEKKSEKECKFTEHLKQLNEAIIFYNDKHKNRQLTLEEVNEFSFQIGLISKENILYKLKYHYLRDFSSYLYNNCNWKQYSSLSKRLFTFEEINDNYEEDIDTTSSELVLGLEKVHNSKIAQVSIRRFKNIKDISFKLNSINLLIGANNSGKSSILQALHFGISCLQTYCNVTNSEFEESTTVTYDELYYKPIDEIRRLGYQGSLGRKDKSIEIEYTSDKGESCQVNIESGRSRGNSLTLKPSSKGYKNFTRIISDTSKSFSYYVTGLAGISSSEEKRGASIVKELAVKGSSNSVFRNIVHMLNEDSNKWDIFIGYFKLIFPEINIYAEYNELEDKDIKIEAEIKGIRYPIDSMGTSVLQIIQMLSYIILFEPKLIILDEPDAHLHPNNQKKVIDLLVKLAIKQDMQIIISTHSKHIVDFLMPTANVIWVSEGEIIDIDDNEKSYVSLMSEIGALEKGALLGGRKIKCCVLTEDEDQEYLKILLESNGFNMDETDIWSYKGCTNISVANAISNFLNERYENLKIIIHIDRDMVPKEDLEINKMKYDSSGINCFITDGSDIESYFINEEHINKLYPSLNVSHIEKIILDAVIEMEVDSKSYVVNSRTVYYNKKYKNDRRKIPDPGCIAHECYKEYEEAPRLMTKGKDLLRRVCGKIQVIIKKNPVLLIPSDFLKIDMLDDISKTITGNKVNMPEKSA
jgi:AAA15 family ATPase/GTPase